VTPRKAGPWLFAVGGAGVLYALGIHRYSWEYAAILAGLILIAFAIRFFPVVISRGESEPDEEPAGEVTHELSLGPLGIQMVREDPPGTDAGSAEGDR
jgi:hypothetical protein